MTPQQVLNELVLDKPVVMDFMCRSDAVNFRNLVATAYHRKLADYILCELLTKPAPSLLSIIDEGKMTVRLTLKLGKKERKHGGPISFQILEQS